MSLEEGIRKMTSFPAQKLGLFERGILRKGFFADVVVLNIEAIQETGTLEAPNQYPRGIDHVIVNGQIVLHNGVQNLGSRPGKIL